jgi:DNA adenine methylase
VSRAPFSRYGGKYYMLSTILPLLPPHEIWVEAFCGAAWVTMAKRPAPVEVINDLDDGIVNFYRVLRDPVLMPQLQEALEMTPYARAEYILCRDTWRAQTDGLEKARRWYVTVRQSVVGNIGNTGWSYATGGESVKRWQRTIEGLQAVHERLRFVQVEHRDWRPLLEFWNKPSVLLYCDPPYVLSTRVAGAKYAHEMSDADHRDLVARLLDFRGRVLLSGYRHPMYAPLVENGWRCLDIDQAAHSTGSTKACQIKQMRTESLWLNFDPVGQRGQGALALEEVS